ncbi:unnamed protein product [Caenorhabditis auriculariae]|uniref:G protein-coupled receptor n=1 Tax=Caenorhabditis auriculariae TaxID=2777116 RepID=A0A8S1HF46_9PELO|nr:unnamed protein product [Caenorhabditis auriculariae]
MLVKSLVIINLVHAILLLVLLSTHLLMWLILEPCDAVLPAFLCFCFRLPLNMCFLMNALFLCGMSIERTLATLQKTSYGEYSSISGFFIIGFLTILGFSSAVFSQRKYAFDMHHIYCSGASSETMNDLSLVMTIMGVAEVLAFIYTAGLYLLNRRYVKIKVYDNLQRQSQLSENVAALELLVPWFAFHLVFYVSFSLSGATLARFKPLFSEFTDFRAFVSMVYTIPIYTLFSPIIVQSVLRRGASLRKQRVRNLRRPNPRENDVYFGIYDQKKPRYVVRATHLFMWFTLDPCDAVLPAFVCLIFRLPLISCYMISSLFLCGMTIERTIATVLHTAYGQCSTLGGYVILFIMATVGIASAVFSQRNYNFDTSSIYCTGASKEVFDDMRTVTYVFGAVEVLVIVYTAVLYAINRLQLRVKFYHNLQRESQISENVEALELLFPLFVFHFSLFLVFNGTTSHLDYIQQAISNAILFRAFVTVNYMIPIYTLISPVIVQGILKRGANIRKKKLDAARRVQVDVREVYFGIYQKHW